VNEFLLLGARPPASGETSPARAAHDMAVVTAWHRWLRRWGLLRAFSLPQERAAEPLACLVVWASGPAAARRLGAAWGRVTGYRVTVLPLLDGAAGKERER
jgi:hypothetical protein